MSTLQGIEQQLKAVKQTLEASKSILQKEQNTYETANVNRVYSMFYNIMIRNPEMDVTKAFNLALDCVLKYCDREDSTKKVIGAYPVSYTHLTLPTIYPV